MKLIRRQFIKEVRSDGIGWIWIRISNGRVLWTRWWTSVSIQEYENFWAAGRLLHFIDGPLVRVSQILTCISRSEECSGPVEGRSELWDLICVYGSYIDQRITTVCCWLCATYIHLSMVADSSLKQMVAPASPLRLFICVCLSSPLPFSFPSGFVSCVLSHCGDDRRIGVRLPVRVGGFSLCRCVETYRPWDGLRQEGISRGVSQRGVQLITRFLLLSKDQKEWNHPTACLWSFLPAIGVIWLFFLAWRNIPYWAKAVLLSRIRHHTQTHHGL